MEFLEILVSKGANPKIEFKCPADTIPKSIDDAISKIIFFYKI